ncbi:MAG: mandelate racemase/muconate lactonizing enzyme family protein [Salinibacterium sp.]|nr:mandelate racemase/muconate lactonizing enzyme family protein [Salinibacterium sp.]
MPTSPSPKLRSIETVRSRSQSNVLHVLLTDEDGLVGLGETFFSASSVEDYIHETAATVLRNLERHAPALVQESVRSYVGYSGSGAEVRGNSAIDIALWDLLGKRHGVPLRELLGGPVVDSIPVYNTCAGANYVSAESRQSTSNWGVASPDERGEYEDLWRFLNEPAALARDLVAAGFRGMKVWPFDIVAEQSRGDHTADLSFGLGVLDAIRGEVGNAIDLYVELHGLWQPSGAKRLLRALEPYDLIWAEDPIRPDNPFALAALRAGTTVPIAVGENIGAGQNAYKPLFDAQAIDVAIIDVGWSGGITSAMKTAALAEQYGIPIAPHDCTGPVALAVATHLVTAVPNGFVQEVARAFLHEWYPVMATGLPIINDGMIRPADAPGHGVVLAETFLADAGTTRRATALID